jgi:hypothetical protein
MPIMVPDLLAATDVMRAKCIAVVDDLHAVWALLQRARSSSATVAAAASS